MHFDWYAATIPERSAEVGLEMLHAGLGGVVVDNERGMNGFSRSWSIRGPEGVRCTFLAGGVNPYPHAFASGDQTAAFVDVVRGHWPGNHDVSRMDSAQDFDEVGCWDKLKEACLTVAKRLDLLAECQGDWVGHNLGVRGRTLYIGSRKSACYVRLYEKGKQMRGLNPAIALKYSENWIRLEAQIRPDRNNRDKAAIVSPLEAWGFSTTTQEILAACTNQNVPRIESRGHNRSNLERTLDYLAHHFTKTFTLGCVEAGGAESFGRQFMKRVARVQLTSGRSLKLEP